METQSVEMTVDQMEMLTVGMMVYHLVVLLVDE
jgi:hypothetical protein